MQTIKRNAVIAAMTLFGMPSAAWPQTAPQPAQHDHGAASAAAPVAEVRRGRPEGREWSSYPLLLPAMSPRGERNVKMLKVKNLAAENVEVFAPDGPPDKVHRAFPLTPEGARVEAATPQSGNYYWVSARAEQDGQVTVASTAVYFGNPGEAPTRMLLTRKHELEIIPQPLPREHGSYRESEKWRFLVRFQGQPLANQRVRMETESGSRITFTSDANGLTTVLFPYDFKAEKPQGADAHHGGPRRAHFVLATEHEADGKHYLSAFNYSYSPDAERNRNLAAGIGFGVFGMVLAAPLLRRRKNNGEKEA